MTAALDGVEVDAKVVPIGVRTNGGTISVAYHQGPLAPSVHTVAAALLIADLHGLTIIRSSSLRQC